MSEWGEPVSFLVLETGCAVVASDGERVGEVAEVRADEERDIFDGVVVARGLLGTERRLVPSALVEEIYERAVVLTIDSTGFRRLEPLR